VVVRFLRVLEKAASRNFQVFFATMENGLSFGAGAFFAVFKSVSEHLGKVVVHFASVFDKEND